MSKKISAGTIARTIALVLALFNQFMVMTGHKIIEIADDDIYNAVSLIFTMVTSVIAWWKNNSFTAAAIKGDEVTDALKSGSVDSAEIDHVLR